MLTEGGRGWRTGDSAARTPRERHRSVAHAPGISSQRHRRHRADAPRALFLFSSLLLSVFLFFFLLNGTRRAEERESVLLMENRWAEEKGSPSLFSLVEQEFLFHGDFSYIDGSLGWMT